MEKVETYSSLKEKGEFFEQTNIKTRDQLDEIIESYKVNENNILIFRGCKEAHYKLYNKAQREWIGKEIYNLGFTFKEFIENEIKNARNWQGGLLDKFFMAFGQPSNDLIILGFLQHYGAPTTLLDWTYSFDNSLFFATDRLKNYESNNEIDNYFSIYIYNTAYNEFLNYIIALVIDSKIFEHMQPQLSEEAKELKIEDQKKMNKFYYHDLVGESVSLIPGYNKDGFSYKNEKISFNLFYNQQNLNIINQKGLFILNASEDKPLEYFFRGRSFEDTDNRFYNYPQFKCLNIHKSLLEYSLKYLNDRTSFPINKEFIFPQEELIAKNAYQQALNFEFKYNE